MPFDPPAPVPNATDRRLEKFVRLTILAQNESRRTSAPNIVRSGQSTRAPKDRSRVCSSNRPDPGLLNVVTEHQVWPDVGRRASLTDRPLPGFMGASTTRRHTRVEGGFLVMSTTDVDNSDIQGLKVPAEAPE